jgi:putative transposase
VTRECLRALLDTSISGKRVVHKLAVLIAERGDRQRQPNRAHLERSAAQNEFVESINGSISDELPNETLFFTIRQARSIPAHWVDDYKIKRPHSSIVYTTQRRSLPNSQSNGRV